MEKSTVQRDRKTGSKLLQRRILDFSVYRMTPVITLVIRSGYRFSILNVFKQNRKEKTMSRGRLGQPQISVSANDSTTLVSSRGFGPPSPDIFKIKIKSVSSSSFVRFDSKEESWYHSIRLGVDQRATLFDLMLKQSVYKFLDILCVNVLLRYTNVYTEGCY